MTAEGREERKGKEGMGETTRAAMDTKERKEIVLVIILRTTMCVLEGTLR